jgi:RND family efflux transporter MFP subunit
MNINFSPKPGIGNRSRPIARRVVPLFLAALAPILSGCGKPHPTPLASAALPTVEVRTRPVENKPVAAVEEVVGTVRAKLRATLEAKVSGRITALPAVLGQRVKAGDMVTRLDAPEIRARLEQAAASLQQAEREWKRVSNLFNQQASTRAEYDSAEARYEVAKGALAEAKAQMSFVEILAPFDGVVTKKWVDVGDLAAPGKPLVEIEDPTKLQLEADVPEAIAGRIQPGATLAFRTGQAEPDSTAIISEIAPMTDPVSRTLRVKLDIPEPGSMRSGQFARLAVPLAETSSLRVPVSAVVQRGQMEIVFAVEKDRARMRLVKTGRRIAEDWEILSGVDSGDQVVVEGAGRLADGQPVQLK